MPKITKENPIVMVSVSLTEEEKKAIELAMKVFEEIYDNLGRNEYLHDFGISRGTIQSLAECCSEIQYSFLEEE